MNKKLEDNLGKLAMLLFFGYISVQQLISVAAIVLHRAEIPLWQLALLSRVASTTFLILIVYFTITRLPPRGIAAGIEPSIGTRRAYSLYSGKFSCKIRSSFWARRICRASQTRPKDTAPLFPPIASANWGGHFRSWPLRANW